MADQANRNVLIDLMQGELDKLWGNTDKAKNFTIFRTPHIIYRSKKNLFDPSVISIGPFHHGQEHLRAMEEQKWLFLQDFLSWNQITLDLCISEMKLLEKRTRGCYSETVGLDSNAFVEMMLLDGCFVLQYFNKLRNKDWASIEEVGWNSYFIDRDLLLLENQIPFFIVKKLYNIGFPLENGMNFVTDQLVRILKERRLLNESIHYTKPNPPTEIHHLVHLCYHYLVPKPETPVVLSSKSFTLTRMFNANRIINGLFHRLVALPNSTENISSPSAAPQSLSGVPLPNSTGNISSMVIPSATELKLKGVKFTPKREPRHILDISFEYGVLKIPRLEITDDTKTIFANLLAFEHSKHGKTRKPFTRFVAFVDNLVNTPNDVTILQECEIIENWLGSEEEVTHFLNHVTEYNDFDSDHYLAKLYIEVNRYIGSSWHRQRAKFIRDYCSSPFATISLIAAVILLVLTLIQSFFTVFAYFRPPPPLATAPTLSP